jgi:hypothetical protein
MQEGGGCLCLFQTDLPNNTSAAAGSESESVVSPAIRPTFPASPIHISLEYTQHGQYKMLYLSSSETSEPQNIPNLSIHDACKSIKG